MSGRYGPMATCAAPVAPRIGANMRGSGGPAETHTHAAGQLRPQPRRLPRWLTIAGRPRRSTTPVNHAGQPRWPEISGHVTYEVSRMIERSERKPYWRHTKFQM